MWSTIRCSEAAEGKTSLLLRRRCSRRPFAPTSCQRLHLNGDALFDPEALRTALASREAPITSDWKACCDSDDMEVQVDGGRLRSVGKTLDLGITNGELDFLEDLERARQMAASWAVAADAPKAASAAGS
jgi:choline kinase